MAIPAQIQSIEGEIGRAEVAGAFRAIDLRLVPEVRPGDWVLIAFGSAVQILDEETALETIAVLNELARCSVQPAGKN